MDWVITWKVFGIIYVVVLIPAFKTALAFWFFRDQHEIASKAMSHGFIFGFISIWLIYPLYMLDRLFKYFKNK